MFTLALLVLMADASDEMAIERAFEVNGAQAMLDAARDIERDRGADAAVTTLSQLLDHKNRKLRVAAFHALGQMGDAGKAALPDISRFISDYVFSSDLREAGLGDIPIWLTEAALQPDDKTGAFSALQSLRPQDERLAALLAVGLAHDDLDIRWRAAALLSMVGESGAAAHAALVRVLEEEPTRAKRIGEYHSSQDIREQALIALGSIRAEPEETVPLLLRFLKHEEPELRQASALGLGRMGELAKEAVPALVATLGDDECGVLRASCAWSAHPTHAASIALVNIGDASIVPLVEALGSENPTARWRAAEALAYFGGRAAKATEPLIARLRDENAEVRSWAAEALSWIAPGDERLVAEFDRLTRDDSANVRATAASMLAYLKSEKPIPVESLVRLLDDDDARVREAAFDGIEHLSPPGVLEHAIQKLLDDPDEDVRFVARDAHKRLLEKQQR